MQKLAKRIRVENLCSICILLRISEADRVLCHLIIFNRLFTLEPQNEIQLLSTDYFLIHGWLVYWVAPLDK